MGQPRRIDIGDERSGIVIEYTKSRDKLRIWGYYDTYVGIGGVNMSVDEFCEKLGLERSKKYGKQ